MNRLSDDRQAALADFIDHHTLAEAVAYLDTAEGIKTTQSSLTKFRASYQTRQDLDKDSGSLDANIDQSQQASHGLTREQLFDIGQERLMIRAIRLGSHTAWSKIHHLRQNQERICQNQERIRENAEWRKLEERRVKLLEQQAKPAVEPERGAKQRATSEEHAAHVRRSLGLPEDYVFPGVREREQKAREQEEQERQRRAAKSNKNAPSPVPPPQPAPTTPPNPAPENAESSTCRPGAPTGRQEPTTATGALPPSESRSEREGEGRGPHASRSDRLLWGIHLVAELGKPLGRGEVASSTTENSIEITHASPTPTASAPRHATRPVRHSLGEGGNTL